MPKKPIVFFSHKCQHSQKMIQQLKEGNLLNMCICINVSRPSTYKFKIPPQIKSVPSIMDQNGQVITGMFARNFITTVLPQMKHSDPLKRPPSGNIPGDRPQLSSSKPDDSSGGGLLSSNFGTEFSGFSYLPGGNDINEDFSDFQNLSGGGSSMISGGSADPRKAVSGSGAGGTQKAQDLQERLDAMKASRDADLHRR